jgi:hypothetical protein
MNAIFRYVVLAAFAFGGRRFLGWVLAGGATGSGQGAPSPGFAQTHFAPLLETVTGAHFAARDLGLVAGGTVIYSLVLGYVARALIGERGFGPRISGLIALMGAWSALAIHAFLFAAAASVEIVIIVTISGSFAFLFAAAAAKTFVTGEFEAFMSGRTPKVSAAYARVLESQQTGPSADRMRAMVSRGNR